MGKFGDAVHTKSAAPKGSAIEDDGFQLSLTTRPMAVAPSPAELNLMLEEWGYDADEFEVDPTQPMRVGGHESAAMVDGVWSYAKLRNFRFMLRRRVDADGNAFRVDVDELVKRIHKRKPAKVAPAATSAGFVIFLADWQIGKGNEAGGGSPETIDRVQAAIVAKVATIKRLKPSHVVLAGMGDWVEGCTGFYDEQPTRIDLDNRQQIRTAANLLIWCVDQVIACPTVERVTVSAVPSNHGENRTGKRTTVTDMWRDNKDLQILDRVAEAMNVNPDRYGHVTTVEPADEWPEMVALQIDGMRLATHHGHLLNPKGKAVGGTHRIAVVRKWWETNIANRRGAADCDAFVVAHGHHLLIDEAGVRPVMQLPASDGGSEHFSTMTGSSSPSGCVSFLFGVHADPTGRRPWAQLEID